MSIRYRGNVLATWSNGKVYVKKEFYPDVVPTNNIDSDPRAAFTGEVYLYDFWVIVVFTNVGAKTQQVAIPREFIRRIEGGP